MRSDANTMTDFWNRVNTPSLDECWEWTGSKDKDGYGVLRFRGKRYKAHRLVMRAPADVWVLHKCDNPPCVNPEHLFYGSAKDNTQDMIAKGRKASVKGSRNPCSKLTEQQVRNIRLAYASGNYTHSQIANEYGVARQTIGDIVNRRDWKWVD